MLRRTWRYIRVRLLGVLDGHLRPPIRILDLILVNDAVIQLSLLPPILLPVVIPSVRYSVLVAAYASVWLDDIPALVLGGFGWREEEVLALIIEGRLGVLFYDLRAGCVIHEVGG